MKIITISGSRLRKYVLRIFFTNSEREYYIHQLARLTKFPASNIQRELKNLVKMRILTTRKIGNIKLHRVNKNYFLYNELSSIIFKLDGVEGLTKRNLQKIKNIKLAFIYGDFVSKKKNNKSTIKLFIVGEPHVKKLIHRIEHIEKRLLRNIEYTLVEKYDLRVKNQIKKISPKIILLDKINKEKNVSCKNIEFINDF